MLSKATGFRMGFLVCGTGILRELARACLHSTVLHNRKQRVTSIGSMGSGTRLAAWRRVIVAEHPRVGGGCCEASRIARKQEGRSFTEASTLVPPVITSMACTTSYLRFPSLFAVDSRAGEEGWVLIVKAGGYA